MINSKKDGITADCACKLRDAANCGYLGFHIVPNDCGEKYAVFRVLAPNAKRVFLVGDFNDWQDSLEAVPCGDGIFEASIPQSEIHSGQNYKFKIETSNGKILFKADPYAIHSESESGGASKIFLSAPFVWHDDGYLCFRKKLMALDGKDFPMNAYKITLSGWGRDKAKTFGEISDDLIPYLKQMGYTHLQLEWEAQSFSSLPAFGDPDDFRRFADSLHNAGLGLIIEWNLSLDDKKESGLCGFDGTELYEFSDDGQKIFDLGKKSVCEFLTFNALYLIEEFHVDGLFCDIRQFYGHDELCEEAVFRFFQSLNSKISLSHPDVFTVVCAPSRIKNTTDKDGQGFTFSQDRQLEKAISSFYPDAFSAHGDKVISTSEKDAFSSLDLSKIAIACKMLSPSKKLTLMGCEIGQFEHNDDGVMWQSLSDVERKKHQLFVRDINKLYLSSPVLWQDEAQLLASVHSPYLFSLVRINKSGGAYKELTAVVNVGKDDLHDVTAKTAKARTLKKVLASKDIEKETFDVFKGSDGEFYFKTSIPAQSVVIFEPTDEV